MRKLILLIILLSGMAFAQNECPTGSFPDSRFNVVDSSGITHQAMCYDYGTGNMRLPYMSATGAGSIAAFAFSGGAITNPITGPAGSVAAPVYSFTAHANTGMYNDASQGVDFADAGIPAFRVTANSGTGLVINQNLPLCFSNAGSSVATCDTYAKRSSVAGLWSFGDSTPSMLIGSVVSCSGAAAGVGVFCYDETLNKFRFSENNGALANAFGAANTPAIYFGACNGTATASSGGLGLLTLGQLSTLNCTGVYGNANSETPIPSAGTLKNLRCAAAPNGVNASSGVVTIMKAGVSTGITCTIGTGQTCNDTTHTAAVVAGDTVGVSFSTQAAETLGNVRCSFEKQ